jgi:hypothetical protein
MKWYRNHRENGLVEIICSHGVGHPSRGLTRDPHYYAPHGCCGCCSWTDFHLVEQQFIADPGLMFYEMVHATPLR